MINQLYQEIILEHNRSDKHRGELVNATAIERGHNPNCGDDLTLMLKVEDDMIVDAKFVGTGCAISTASMSIMIDLVKGHSVARANELINLFLALIKGEALDDNQLRQLRDAAIFESLKDMPARVKCGTLAWHCLRVIIN